MPGETPEAKNTAAGSVKGENGDLSKEEEEAAWQRAIEMMLSGEGLEALGLDKDGQPKNPTRSPPPAPGKSSKPEDAKPSFEETMRKTMEQLQNPQTKASRASDPTDIAALLAQLGSDPSALAGLDEDGDGLGGILDGMMAQLMTKEVLEEPMSELAAKVSE
jgi:peroxin-19